MAKPEAVIGIDPGGDGTTGLVICRDWRERAGIWWPWDIEAESAEYFTPGVALCQRVEDSARRGQREHFIACEDFVTYQALDSHGKRTVEQIGVLKWEIAISAMVKPDDWRDWLMPGRRKRPPPGTKRPNINTMTDRALLEAYGGRETAVGGKKCQGKCKGKGYYGHAVPEPTDRGDWEMVDGSSWKRTCPDCQGLCESPRGPLCPLWKPSKPHCRPALAVAVYAYNVLTP